MTGSFIKCQQLFLAKSLPSRPHSSQLSTVFGRWARSVSRWSDVWDPSWFKWTRLLGQMSFWRWYWLHNSCSKYDQSRWSNFHSRCWWWLLRTWLLQWRHPLQQYQYGSNWGTGFWFSSLSTESGSHLSCKCVDQFRILGRSEKWYQRILARRLW